MIKVDIRNGMLAVACPFSQTFLSFAHMRGSPSFIVGESRLRQAEHSLRSARSRSPSTDIVNTSSPPSYPSFRNFRADFAGNGIDSSRNAGV